MSEITISFYRDALKKYDRADNVYVMIGNIYLEREQLDMADKYYKAALEISPKSPNARLGQAKILYYRKKYYMALVVLKYIQLDQGYDKSLHYVYGECAYKLGDYKTASDQYNQLLKYRNDKFFLANSVSLIKHKIDLCRRFLEIR